VIWRISDVERMRKGDKVMPGQVGDGQQQPGKAGVEPVGQRIETGHARAGQTLTQQ
jgi:hypothetical protein